MNGNLVKNAQIGRMDAAARLGADSRELLLVELARHSQMEDWKGPL
jgi:hypothetical protein